MSAVRTGAITLAATPLLAATEPLCVRLVEPVAVEMPLPTPIRTPMTTISNVVTLMLRVEDEDGTEGWGEIWCNFPRFGVHHRARILRELVAPLVIGRAFDSPADCSRLLETATRIVRLQAGEPGPMRSVIAGLDIALWDIAAKKSGQALWQLLGGRSSRVPIYVSVGWGPAALTRVRDFAASGICAFKIRSSGEAEDHRRAVTAARQVIGPESDLMLDLNSSWTEEAAAAGMSTLASANLSWLEEPVPVDTPAATWLRLARAAPMPLAGGENMLDAEEVEAALNLGALTVLQPDLTKWGGFSGILPLGRRIVAEGRRFCPHMFGGAPGTLAAAHLLAASNAADGILEWGVNHNPVRDALMRRDLTGSAFELEDTPGLGLRIDHDVVREYRIEV